MPDSFSGLPRQTPKFLAALAANNNRPWFEAHRAEYEALWLTPGLDLVEALGPVCQSLDPPLMAVPKLNGSLRRIHRDIRFSKDKSPYSPHLNLMFAAESGAAHSGVHIVVSAAGFGFGAGEYGLSPDRLEAFRAKVATDAGREGLLAALAPAEALGGALDPPDLARVPKGYEPAPWDQLIRRKSLILRTQDELPMPDWMFTAQAVDEIGKILAALVPLIGWLQAL